MKLELELGGLRVLRYFQWNLRILRISDLLQASTGFFIRYCSHPP